MSLLIILMFVLAIVVAYARQPKIRGKRGENRVKRVIGTTIENERYVINDWMVSHHGRTSQIDHIVINPHGIFVIETKNYSGSIYGTEEQREWTQVLAYGKVKNKFYNPLKQNETHVYAVKKIVGNLPVYSLVVFVQNNTENIVARNVIPLSALRRILQSGETVLSAQQMQSVYEALLSNTSDITLQEHVAQIKMRQRQVEQGICPRCGGALVLRNGRYGEFFGCSRYPSCRFIKNI